MHERWNCAAIVAALRCLQLHTLFIEWKTAVNKSAFGASFETLTFQIRLKEVGRFSAPEFFLWSSWALNEVTVISRCFLEVKGISIICLTVPTPTVRPRDLVVAPCFDRFSLRVTGALVDSPVHFHWSPRLVLLLLPSSYILSSCAPYMQR